MGETRRRKRPHRARTVRTDDQHLARLDVALPARVDEVQRARLRTDDVRLAEPAERERPEPMRIPNGNQPVFRQQDQRERTLGLRNRLDQRLLGRRRHGPGVQVQQHLGVARRLEDGSLPHEVVAQLLGVDEVAVMADGDLAVGAVDDDRLRVVEPAVARRGVPDVADGTRPGEPRNRSLVEGVGHLAFRLAHLQPAPVRRGDAGALLAAMLQRVQAEVREVGGLRMTVDAEDAALFLEFVHYRQGPLHPAKPARAARLPPAPIRLRGASLQPVCQRRAPACFRLRDAALDGDPPVDRQPDRRPASAADGHRRDARLSRSRQQSRQARWLDAHDDLRRRLAEQRRRNRFHVVGCRSARQRHLGTHRTGLEAALGQRHGQAAVGAVMSGPDQAARGR